MKLLRVRVADLHLYVSREGIQYQAYILVGGSYTAVNGKVKDGLELDLALCKQVRQVYFTVVGESYPDDAPFLA